MKTLLVVDDSVINLKSIKRLLSNEYKVVAVNSAQDAFNYLSGSRPDLILLDILMPEMDGFQIMDQLKANPTTADIPVIFLTADEDKDKEVRGFRMGAMDFIRKPFEPDIVLGRIARAIELDSLRHNLECEVAQKAKMIENITLQSIMAVAETVDSKDYFAREHSVRVAAIAEEMAHRLAWSEDRIQEVHYCALLHDIGKIGLPDALLNRSSVYTPEERTLMQTHTKLGAEVLENISIRNAKSVALTHHEHFDGSGYPSGISGEDIPIQSRLIAIADACEAMISDRSYRKKYSMDHVRSELAAGSGTQFDPELIPIILAMIDEGYFDSFSTTNTAPSSKDLVSDPTSLLHRVMQEVNSEVYTEASKDVLTGLWNRRYTAQAVDRILNMPKGRGTAFMMDLDNFKGINDTYGHIFGDEILINIAHVIDGMVRSGDIACRIGGDEFFLFFNNLTNEKDAEKLAERLIKNLSEKVLYPDKSRGVSVSIGLAVSPRDGVSFEELYAKADKALYYAKNNGKSIFHLYTGDNEPEFATESVQEDLDAIRRMLSEKEPISGSYYVEYESFKNIARFLRRSVERKNRDVVFTLFTLTGKTGLRLTTEAIPELMQALESSIHDSLRIGDVATRYSSTQMLVILIDTNEENAGMVAGRIFSDFLKRAADHEVELHYDLKKMIV